MYYENYVLSIIEVETKLPISVLSLQTDSTGVTFSNSQQPTLLVEVDTTLVNQIISISVPTANGATNVNQLEFAFYGLDGKVILNSYNEPWIVETTPGVTMVYYT